MTNPAAIPHGGKCSIEIWTDDKQTTTLLPAVQPSQLSTAEQFLFAIFQMDGE